MKGCPGLRLRNRLDLLAYLDEQPELWAFVEVSEMGRFLTGPELEFWVTVVATETDTRWKEEQDREWISLNMKIFTGADERTVEWTKENVSFFGDGKGILEDEWDLEWDIEWVMENRMIPVDEEEWIMRWIMENWRTFGDGKESLEEMPGLEELVLKESDSDESDLDESGLEEPGLESDLERWIQKNQMWKYRAARNWGSVSWSC